MLIVCLYPEGGSSKSIYNTSPVINLQHVWPEHTLRTRFASEILLPGLNHIFNLQRHHFFESHIMVEGINNTNDHKSDIIFISGSKNNN